MKYSWKKYSSAGGETRKYRDHCARKFGVREHIRFNMEAQEASWDEAAAEWKVVLR